MYEADCRKLYKALASWFEAEKRPLPWRENKDPYRIWISEIMLQQTQVVTVIPYFERWMKLWPNLSQLAEAEEEAVLKAWEGLGYYSRARNILKTARLLKAQGLKTLPSAFKELRALPGLGDYTAGAVASLAFDEAVPAVDGNVLRVVSRLASEPYQAGAAKDLRSCREKLSAAMASLRKEDSFSPGLMNEALIELGATVCRPKETDCERCPFASACRARAEGHVLSYPLPKAKSKRSFETYTVLIMEDKDGKIAVRKRRSEGLLASLWEFPMAEGERTAEEIRNGLEEQGFVIETIEALKPLKHVFSHITWELSFFCIRLIRPFCIRENELLYKDDSDDINWLGKDEIKDLPFSSALSEIRDYYCL